MPIYEYACRTCGNEFETLVRASSPAPECPSCNSADLQKKISTFSANSRSAFGAVSSSASLDMLPPEVYSTAFQNITGHPAISLPAGLYPSGLPFGLQVTAPRWHDHDLIAIARRWEQAFPWPRVAPGYTEFSVRS